MLPTSFPTLETARLHLREITQDDAEALLRIHGDAKHMAFFGTDPLTTLEQARKVVQVFADWRLQPNPGTRWGLALKDRRGLIGSCGLFKWDRGWRRCTLGYELAPEATGQGLMREALAAVLTWGFEHMALHRIEAQVHEHNTPSRHLLSSLGFAEEGRLREIAYWGGQHHDLLQYGLLERDFPQVSTPRG